MRSKQVAAVLGLTLAVLTTTPARVEAQGMAQLAMNGQASASTTTTQQAAAPWYERAWRWVRAAFGESKSAKATWTGGGFAEGSGCGSLGCNCCHSSIMVPRNVDRSFVHPSPSGSTEDVDSLYLRSAKAISRMEARKRDQVRRGIRLAISDGDSSRARRLIDASVANPPEGSK
jgi:hypothetical protein